MTMAMIMGITMVGQHRGRLMLCYRTVIMVPVPLLLARREM